VTVIDARNYSVCRKKFGSFFRKQSEFADFFALSKSDALDAVALDALHAELGEVNPRAEQLRVAPSDVAAASLSAMLDGRGAAASGADAVIKEIRRSGHRRDYRPSPSAGHGIEVVTCEFCDSAAVVGTGELANLLGTLADGSLGDVVRAKGRLWQGNGQIDFSLVAGQVEIAEPVAAADGAPDRRGEIVIFGKDLDQAGLRALFQATPAKGC
ncbi:MAG: GTP-binding protein, partial [Propionivibrio sp.]